MPLPFPVGSAREDGEQTTPPVLEDAGPSGYRAGSGQFRHVALALFAAGMATFMTVWCVQGLLPAFSAEFGVTPGRAAMAVSATTALLALAIVPVSMLSERFGRVPIMVRSALSATVVGSCCRGARPSRCW